LFGPVRRAENWVTTTDLFEMEEGVISCFQPNKLLAFASEVIERTCDVREVLNERPIEVAET